MNKDFLQKITQLLQQQKEEIALSLTNHPVDTEGDETDNIQGSILIHLNNSLNNRNLQKTQQINNALLRISNGTYGKCEECEEPIPEKRLLANPCVLTCVGCAGIREDQMKHRRS